MFLDKGDLISGDAGHNCNPDIGANGYKLEDNLTKEVWGLIKNKLISSGYSGKDCTPWGISFDSVSKSLEYRVNLANSSNSKLHLCIHFNSGGGSGVECWISSKGGSAEIFANQITVEISKLGYINRGVKTGNLYVPKYTTMPCVLVECAFVDSMNDMNMYNADNISNAIVKAITNTKIENESNTIEDCNNFSYVNNAKVINDFLYLRDANGNIIKGRQIDINDNITVLGIDYNKQLAFVEYQTLRGVKSGYVTNATNCIEYYYEYRYVNGSTSETVYDENGTAIGSLSPWEHATPLFRKNNKLYVVYDTDKGKNTKAGYVIYDGGFTKF